MEKRSFNDLITDLRQRRIVGELPPVLLLGAGASVEAGIGAMPEVYKFFNVSDFDGFEKVIGSYTMEERYRNLYQFLQTRDPSKVTPGYSALAALCASAYFDLVLAGGILEQSDESLGKPGSAQKLYNGLAVSDQAQIREFYLSKIEEVDSTLRTKYQKLYRYY